MSLSDVERLRSVKSFPSLVKYLRDELGWPVESDDFDDLTYDYEPDELGLDSKMAAKIKDIKQLRPLTTSQPFGIFFINFDPKRLPVVVLRRILRALVLKKRTAADKAQQAAWAMNDLLFISSYGEANERAISFAHFREDEHQPADLPTLRVLGWDGADTVLHLGHAHHTLRDKLRWPDNENDPEAWRRQWSSAFSIRHREVITTAKALASRLAHLAREIRNRVNAVLAVESKSGAIRKLHAAFKEALIHDLSEDDFADMYAQTIAYGLLSARVSRPAGLVADNLLDMVPVTNPFLQELLESFLHIGGRGRKRGSNLDFDELGVTEVVETLRHANMEAILRDFGDRNPQEDPVIHFYEVFLKEYDAKKRMQRGVFYTPRPVVSFIVRSVHELLQTEFGLPDGLADTATWADMLQKHPDMTLPTVKTHKPGSAAAVDVPIDPATPFVQILDPATGTATFLVEVIEVIYATLRDKWRAQGKSMAQVRALWNEYVPKHLLPRIYGYELMMAPYAIAHMKIGLILQATGYDFNTPERVRIYLTNALEPPQDFSGHFDFDVPALAHEAKAVNDVKRNQRFTVVVGNPPYFGEAGRGGEWIAYLMRGLDLVTGEKTANYFTVDGRPLGERNPKWLNDDYVKFMRRSEWEIERSGIGILSFITNHSYLDNPTFRGMRRSLMTTFSRLCLLDLHGNSKRKEKAPSGAKDENVFDIAQGVAINLCARLPRSGAACDVQVGDLFGDRQSKYDTLGRLTASSAPRTGVTPAGDLYLFGARSDEPTAEYFTWWKITDVFPVNSVGIVTARDDLTIHETPEKVWETVQDFAALPPEEARARYNLGRDARDWKVAFAQEDVRASGPDRSFVVPILYRPFDTRWTYYTGRSRGFICMPRSEVMRHMVSGGNLGLTLTRSIETGRGFEHVFCAREITQHHTVSIKEVNYLIPLYNTVIGKDLLDASTGKPNLSRDFMTSLADLLRSAGVGAREPQPFIAPEPVFSYIYALLHSVTYRTRYAEALRSDFPRIPLPGSLALFRGLSELGGELVGLHLMESARLERPMTRWVGEADGAVEKVTYARETVWVDKAQGRGFEGVPEAVWNFHIGGYQVCQKWLKDRKGRTLSDDDKAHYHRIVVALSETIRIMGEIDGVIEGHGGWPGAFATGAKGE